MFIDFLGVMLVTLATGLALLAHYLYRDPPAGERRSWAAGFFAVGLVLFLLAFVMVVTWPLPGGFNVAFGGPALFLSAVFLAAAVTLTFEWEPLIPAMLGVAGGILAIVVGVRLIDLHLTQSPIVAGIGYLTAGIGGILTLPALRWRQMRWLALTAAVILGISALVWAFTGYEAVWAHILDFSKWVPTDMLQRLPHGK